MRWSMLLRTRCSAALNSKEHGAVGHVDIRHDHVEELPTLWCQENPNLAAVMTIGKSMDKTAPLQLMERPGRGSAPHPRALGEFGLRETFLFPQHAKELKYPHANAVSCNPRRKGTRHRPHGVGQQKAHGFLEPQMGVAPFIRACGFPICSPHGQSSLQVL